MDDMMQAPGADSESAPAMPPEMAMQVLQKYNIPQEAIPEIAAAIEALTEGGEQEAPPQGDKLEAAMAQAMQQHGAPQG